MFVGKVKAYRLHLEHCAKDEFRVLAKRLKDASLKSESDSHSRQQKMKSQQRQIASLKQKLAHQQKSYQRTLQERTYRSENERRQQQIENQRLSESFHDGVANVENHIGQHLKQIRWEHALKIKQLQDSCNQLQHAKRLSEHRNFELKAENQDLETDNKILKDENSILKSQIQSLDELNSELLKEKSTQETQVQDLLMEKPLLEQKLQELQQNVMDEMMNLRQNLVDEMTDVFEFDATLAPKVSAAENVCKIQVERLEQDIEDKRNQLKTNADQSAEKEVLLLREIQQLQDNIETMQQELERLQSKRPEEAKGQSDIEGIKSEIVTLESTLEKTQLKAAKVEKRIERQGIDTDLTKLRKKYQRQQEIYTSQVSELRASAVLSWEESKGTLENSLDAARNDLISKQDELAAHREAATQTREELENELADALDQLNMVQESLAQLQLGGDPAKFEIAATDDKNRLHASDTDSESESNETNVAAQTPKIDQITQKQMQKRATISAEFFKTRKTRAEILIEATQKRLTERVTLFRKSVATVVL